MGSLSYGIQKRVELGRALAMQPALLLLDEPMAGMNVEEKEDMVRYILDIHELAGVTVVLIKHDMGVVMDISNRVTVLDFGKIIGDGTPAEVMENAQVVEAYLGAGQRRTESPQHHKPRANTVPMTRNRDAMTMPQLLHSLADTKPDNVAMQEKRYGIWQPTTWEAYRERVRDFAHGLASLGVKRGDIIAVLGDNRPEWLISELAAQSLGATVVGIYPSSIGGELQHIISAANSRVVVAEDQEQVDKLLGLVQDNPSHGIDHIIYYDPHGPEQYTDELRDPVYRSKRPGSSLGPGAPRVVR